MSQQTKEVSKRTTTKEVACAVGYSRTTSQSKSTVKNQLEEELKSIFKWYERNVRRERMLSAKRDRSGVDHK